MLGAIAGDVIGSVFEFANHRSREFDLFNPPRYFTDDTVLTVACADAILTGTDFGEAYLDYAAAFPGRGYGGRFSHWVRKGENRPYNSFGNGSAMRASPCGWAAGSLAEALALGERSALATHDHAEGIKGAKAVAGAVFLARTGADAGAIRAFAESLGYDTRHDLDQLRREYEFNETCQGTVPQSFAVVLASTGFEDAIRNAVMIGGDTDTVACIVGAIAEPLFGGVPGDIADRTRRTLDPRLIDILERFTARCASAAGPKGPKMA